MADVFPRDNLVRAVNLDDACSFEERADAPADGRIGTLTGRFSVFNQWTEINSFYEGNFVERIAPSAFRKTVAENRSGMRVLFDHGQDPSIGNKPLGPIESLDANARYSVPLLDTSYNRDLLPGLKAGVYGASFRFQVMKEEIVQNPEQSDYNPKGLPERTITEARVFEFGPVTFPAYAGASAGVRSLTDQFRSPIVPAVPTAPDPEDEVLEPADEATPEERSDVTESETAAEPEHSPVEESRTTPEPDATDTKSDEERTTMHNYNTVEEMDAHIDEIQAVLEEISKEHGMRRLDADADARWKELTAERDELRKDRDAWLERQAYLEESARKSNALETPGAGSHRVAAHRSKAPENIFDTTEYYNRASSQEHMGRLLEEGAKRAVEGFHFPNPDVKREYAQEKIDDLLQIQDPTHEMAQRLLIHGSPVYRSAFWKTLARQPLTPEEQRKFAEGQALEARSLTTTNTGGVTVPVQIDPTVLLTSNGAINPFRQVAKLVRTVSNQWQGVTSTGITAAYAAEGAVMADNAPSLVAPAILPERANAFVPFSWEAAQDWAGLESDMAQLFADSKDILEATKFAVGAGHASNEPQGVLIGAGTVVGTQATVTVGTSDVYALSDALPPRFQARATWLMHQTVASRLRQAAGGANTGYWAQSFQVGVPAELIGYPVYKASSVGTAGGASTPVASVKWSILGDFNFYAIVDRIGFQVRYIDTLFNGNTAGGIAYPNGLSGLVTYWRNSAGVLASNAFRTGTVT